MTSEYNAVDIDFEQEDENGVGGLKAKIAKLKVELAAAKKEAQDNLDGWQRARADAANMLKEARAHAERAESRARESLTEELLPVLDGFDMAMGSSTWGSVSAEWRKGIEYIQSQFVNILSQNGVARFGAAGEKLDHTLHEVISESDEGKESGTVLKVIRNGYKIGDRIIRPAQVICQK
ncbi:nucleotide exchange factor GrpE [bacterium]|nr:nucleotide exchange factor GrpE [bacterium]